MSTTFYKAIGVQEYNREDLRKFSRSIGISLKKLDYYNSNHILPSQSDLELIQSHINISKNVLMLKMGIFNEELLLAISENAEKIAKKTKEKIKPDSHSNLVFETDLGQMYQGDCLNLLNKIEDNSVDMVFADPPFNLNKEYLSKIDDNLTINKYLDWCYNWLDGCIRILKDGGSLLIWNIPKWNTFISNYLNQRLTFKHWIANDIKFSLPISGKFYPSHYSLLYYTKGEKANTFKPDRLPMETCPSCYKELKDYGGYKNKMNPLGINLTDVWYDIPPVRHNKYKKRKEANELSVKLLDRIIEFSTKEGDLIFDPFGGAGTTYIVAQIKNRKWIGIELGPVDDIIKRFDNIEDDFKLINKYRENYNQLFPEKIKIKRTNLGIWTDESFPKKEKELNIETKTA